MRITQSEHIQLVPVGFNLQTHEYESAQHTFVKSTEEKLASTTMAFMRLTRHPTYDDDEEINSFVPAYPHRICYLYLFCHCVRATPVCAAPRRVIQWPSGVSV